MRDSQDIGVSRTVFFPDRLFKAEAVKKAAYRFTDRFSFSFLVGDGGLQVTVTPLTETDIDDLDAMVSRFNVEVLDNDLRLQIAEETAPVRNAILAYAFSKTGLQDST